MAYKATLLPEPYVTSFKTRPPGLQGRSSQGPAAAALARRVEGPERGRPDLGTEPEGDSKDIRQVDPPPCNSDYKG